MARRFRPLERTGRVFSFEPGVREKRGAGRLAVLKSSQAQLTPRYRFVREELGVAGTGQVTLMKFSLFDKAGGLTPVDEVFVEQPEEVLLRIQEANDFAQAQPDLIQEEQRIRDLPKRKTGRIIESAGSEITQGRELSQDTLARLRKRSLSRSPSIRARQLEIRKRVERLAEREARETLSDPRLRRILEQQEDA